jgi:antitoxin HicB
MQTKPETLERCLNPVYPITLYPEPDGGYRVTLRISQGDGLEEAMANIQDAKVG